MFYKQHQCKPSLLSRIKWFNFNIKLKKSRSESKSMVLFFNIISIEWKENVYSWLSVDYQPKCLVNRKWSNFTCKYEFKNRNEQLIHRKRNQRIHKKLYDVQLNVSTIELVIEYSIFLPLPSKQHESSPWNRFE